MQYVRAGALIVGLGCLMVVAGYLAGARADLSLALILVLVGGFALIRRPTAVALVALLVSQEVRTDLGYGDASSLLTLGNQLYFSAVAGVPPAQILLLVAAMAGLAYAGSLAAVRLALPVVLIGGAIAAIAYAQGASVTDAVLFQARPFLIASLAIVVAATTRSQPGGWRSVCVAGAWTLVGLAVWASALYVTGAGRIADGRITLFYDSALPAVAAAVVIAALFGGSRGPRWVLFAAAPAAIVLLSGRRGVWFAAIVAVALWFVARKNPGRVVRIGFVLLVFVGLGWLLAPGLGAAIVDQFLAAVAALQGGRTDASTAGHTSDIEVGWRYALDGPLFGYGYDQGPLPGLSVQTGSLYVHNDLLQIWLRFGLLAAVLLGGLMLLGILRSMKALRRFSWSWEVGVAAAFLMVAPVCAMSAAFYTTTLRWPALLGLAAGALLTAARLDEGPPADRALGVPVVVARKRTGLASDAAGV